MTNFLRLWSSEAIDSFDFQAFNKGDYYDAVQRKSRFRNHQQSSVSQRRSDSRQGPAPATAILFHFLLLAGHDSHPQAARLSLHTFHETYAIQLNDTHPSIAVAELMRLLIDIHEIDWDEAWSITQKTLAYTNHTLLPEALEKWPLPLFASLLPRHLEIIYEINRRFLDEVRAKRPGDDALLSRVSLIDEHDQKYVRMANLATVGSHAVNGVAALHTELLKKTVLHDFYELFPEKFFNVTNGVTPRRWLALSNPELSHLISTKIGDDWLTHEEELRQLEPLADDAEFRAQLAAGQVCPQAATRRLIHERTGMTVSPDTMFDVQVKRIHEYKRQLLNLLYVITLYNRIKRDGTTQITPAHSDLRRKGCPRLFHGQAHHQADQLRRCLPSMPTTRCATVCAWCSSPTSTSRADKSSILPPNSPSKSPLPARKPPEPAT